MNGRRAIPQQRLWHQATASETLQEEREAREANSVGTLSMLCSDEQGNASQYNRIQAAAAETETDAGCSGGERQGLRRVSVSGGEGGDETASAVSWATVDDTAAEESCLDGGWRDSTGGRTIVTKGLQSGNKLSLKEKAAPGNGGDAQQSWGNKKGEDDSSLSSQPTRNGQSSGPLEPEKTNKTLGDDASQSTPSGLSKRQSSLAPTSNPAPQHGGALQQRGREDERHGDRRGDSAGKPARSEAKPAAAALTGQEHAEKSSSDDQEIGDLVIDEHATTPPDSPKQTPWQITLMPAGVGRGQRSPNRDTDATHGGKLTQTLGPSGSGTHSRPQGTTKKVRRDIAGRLEGCTPCSGREEVTATKHSRKATAADHMDTDSNFY
ncbi:hypothetical protein HPB50_028891 [Hyalomma asiaticum]|nr:hypothetical protein HPB50_028891 [Hyalomma asiaticum]